MTEADRKQWGDLLKHYGALFGRVLPAEQAEAWYEELKSYHVIVVSEAMQKALTAHKGAGWFPIATLLEQCRELQREAIRAEENALQREKLRRAAESRGGDGFGFVDGAAEAGEFTDKETMRFAKAIYTLSKTQEGRDWLAKQRCGHDLTPQLNPYDEPRPKALCIMLAKCMRNAINCTTGRRPNDWTEMHEYVNRVIARAELPAVFEGEAAAGGI